MQTFNDIWISLNPKQKQRLAERVGTSTAYLSQIAHGHRWPSRKMARRMVQARRDIKAEMFL